MLRPAYLAANLSSSIAFAETELLSEIDTSNETSKPMPADDADPSVNERAGFGSDSASDVVGSLGVKLGGFNNGGVKDSDDDGTRVLVFENRDADVKSGVVMAGMASASEGIEEAGLIPPSFGADPCAGDVSVMSGITGKTVS